jgi:ABC-type lipopolysaccharide export system ATPase subunit
MLDEPFSHIMPLHVERIKKLILQQKQYKGIIITDHLFKDILDICDNIYLLKDGKSHLTSSLHDLQIIRINDEMPATAGDSLSQ